MILRVLSLRQRKVATAFTAIIFETLDNSYKGYYSVFCVLKNVHDFENEEKIRKTEGIYVQMLKMRRNV